MSAGALLRTGGEKGLQRTGKVAGGALAGAQAGGGLLGDELGVLAALAVEVGQGTVGLHDGAGEALESALRDFAEHLELSSSKTDNGRNSEGEKLHVDGLMWLGGVGYTCVGYSERASVLVERSV